MLLHHHSLPRNKGLLQDSPKPLFYSYEYLRADGWNKYNTDTCWTSGSEGIQLGFVWTPDMQKILQNCTLYKTYELIQNQTEYSEEKENTY